MQYYNMLLHPQTIEFLKWLEDWNDRKFFELYKPLYLQIKENFDNLVTSIIEEISKFDDSIIWLETKKCTFRIYKDMRFPRNREHPYKTNLWAYISANWKKFQNAWYYLHVQNEQSFFSGWIYTSQAKTSNAIRKYIYNNRKEFERIINNPEFKKTFKQIKSAHPKLKKLPKDFDPNHPSIKFLKNRDRLVQKKINNKSILSKNLENNFIKHCKIIQPFNNFLNTALKEEFE
jgi:uncharacterized protein (TIGR02453 family)